MKGLLLSGGTGTRLRPLTYSGAKQLLPIANKPILVYALEAFREAGITDIGIVVGHTAEQVRAQIGDGHDWDVSVSYIRQGSPLGLAHAVQMSIPYLGHEPFVMMLGDNVFQGGIKSIVTTFSNHADAAACVLVGPVAEPWHYGVVKVEHARVVQLVEKPQTFISDLALAGVYAFSPMIYDAIDHISPSPRGELEITDALQWLVTQGHNVTYSVHTGWWKDTGRPDDLLDANRLILEGLNGSIDGDVDEQSRLCGQVRVESGARVVRSTLRGPLIIGAGSIVEDAYIGPYTAVGSDVTICRADIEYSIILQGSCIEGPIHLDRSLIGRDVIIRKSISRPFTTRLIVGDSSRYEW